MERAWLKLVRPAGIILFRRNIEDREADARAARRCDGVLLAALRALSSMWKAERWTGCAMRWRRCRQRRRWRKPRARQRHTPALAREHGELIARAVKAFGFNYSLAPVVDLALPESRKVLGTRCAAATAAEVVAYAREFLAGLAAQGVAGCGKHFPGLGGGTLDSHLETPKIERTWQQLWQEDLVPTARCATRCRWSW